MRFFVIDYRTCTTKNLLQHKTPQQIRVAIQRLLLQHYPKSPTTLCFTYLCWKINSLIHIFLVCTYIVVQAPRHPWPRRTAPSRGWRRSTAPTPQACCHFWPPTRWYQWCWCPSSFVVPTLARQLLRRITHMPLACMDVGHCRVQGTTSARGTKQDRSFLRPTRAAVYVLQRVVAAYVCGDDYGRRTLVACGIFFEKDTEILEYCNGMHLWSSHFDYGQMLTRHELGRVQAAVPCHYRS